MKKLLVSLAILATISFPVSCNDGQGDDPNETFTNCVNSYGNQAEQITKSDLDPEILTDLMSACWSDTSQPLVIKSRTLTPGLASCINDNAYRSDTVHITLVAPVIISGLQGTVWTDTAKTLVIYK